MTRALISLDNSKHISVNNTKHSTNHKSQFKVPDALQAGAQHVVVQARD
jgi:hypothetical protein